VLDFDISLRLAGNCHPHVNCLLLAGMVAIVSLGIGFLVITMTDLARTPHPLGWIRQHYQHRNTHDPLSVCAPFDFFGKTVMFFGRE
jgi:hypothetical protein